MAFPEIRPQDFIESTGPSDPQSTLGNGELNNQIYWQKGTVTQGFRVNRWTWNESGTVWEATPIAPIQGTGNPNGLITPDAVNQGFIDTAAGQAYISTGATNNDWLAI